MTSLYKIWYEDAEHVSSALAVKKFYFKNPRWRTANTIKGPILHHHIKSICSMLDV